MKLITKEIERKIPALYSQDGKGKDAMAQVKFFTPDSSWTWYASEYNPQTGDFFGLVVSGPESELGYFNLAELSSVRGRFGLPVERDLHFKPVTLRECEQKHE